MNGRKSREIRKFALATLIEENTYSDFRKCLKAVKRMYREVKSNLK